MNNNFNNEIKNLLDPYSNHNPLDPRELSKDVVLDILRKLLIIRLSEKKIAFGREKGFIGGPVHLSVGQEAVAVGVSKYLYKSDRVFGAHRSHSHLLALNPNPKKLFCEVLGKSSGFSKGMGGSMHLWDQLNGFYGSVPIVSGTVPLALGAAMAARMQNTKDIAVAYLGDGACEEGVVHECLNFASLYKEPILFVVENNMFASHMHISQRQSLKSTSRFAVANNIPYQVVDGNDVFAVSRAAKELILNSRSGGGPGFLEAFTYRWYGHVDWREDIDVGVSRSQDDVDNWRAKDPIRRLQKGLLKYNYYTLSKLNKLEVDLAKIIDKDWDDALNEPLPNLSSTLDNVYFK